MFNRGEILRTHVLRPTWHFVLPSDIRWMLSLTGARVNGPMSSFYRRWGLDEATFTASRKVIARVLRDGRHAMRRELALALEKAGLVKRQEGALRIIGLLLRAELDALICSGPMVGNQCTYALFDQRAAPSRRLTHEEARAELARRYFRSHGSATVNDFRRWSILTASDARAGLATSRRNSITR